MLRILRVPYRTIKTYDQDNQRQNKRNLSIVFHDSEFYGLITAAQTKNVVNGRLRQKCFHNWPISGLSFTPNRAYIKQLRTAVYRLLAKHTSGRKPTF
jgi:hypothetical protein